MSEQDKKANSKMCPILTGEGQPVGCWGEQCAWWNDDMGACSLKALGRMATYWMLNDSRDRGTR